MEYEQLLNTIKNISDSQVLLSEKLRIKDEIFQKLGISSTTDKNDIPDLLQLNNKVDILEEKINTQEDNKLSPDNKAKNDNPVISSDIEKSFNDFKNYCINQIKELTLSIQYIKKKIAADNKNNINLVKSNTKKERSVVTKSQPVIIQGFSNNALKILKDIFKKVFTIKIIPPKTSVKKRSMVWLIFLGATVSLIIKYFENIKKFFVSIDWSLVWEEIKTRIANGIVKLPPLILSGVKNIGKEIFDILIKIWNTEEVNRAVNNVKNIFDINRIINTIISFGSSLFTNLIPESIKKIYQNIKSFIVDTFKWINSVIGFTFWGNSEEPTPKTFDPDEAIEDTISADGNKLSNNNGDINNPIENNTDNTKQKIDDKLAIENNINNFNNITQGKQKKSLIINDGDNRTTIFPLDPKDQVIIANKNGFLNTKLDELINTINSDTNKYIEKFNDISESINTQNDILSKFNDTNTAVIDNKLTATYNNIMKNISYVINLNTKDRQPKINISGINKKQQYQYL